MREPWRTLLVRLRTTAWIWLPLLVLAALAAPSLWFMLPSYQSELGENYEPLKTLRFAASLGADYHKYGPMTCFLLLPGYAVSLGWWWLRGSFTSPSGDFPYGLAEPLWQISVLILQARVLFFALFLALCALLIATLRRIVARRASASLAFAFCIATSYGAAMLAANDRPDGPAFAFVAAALAMYVRILTDGLRPGPACWMSAFAVFAISCKELAGPLFVLPYVGLIAHFARETRGDAAARSQALRCGVASVGTGVGLYLALNVVYAPSTWLLRMQHWLGGEGTSQAIWRSTAETPVYAFALEHLGSLLNVLGPGGIAVAVVALATLAAKRPRHTGMLILPFVSIFLLGLIPLGLPGERFYVFAAMALVAPVAVGIDVIWSLARPGFGRGLLGFATGVALGANALLGTFAWTALEGTWQRSVENSLAAYPMQGGALNLLSYYPRAAGKSRLRWLGYDEDLRTIFEIAADPPERRPARIYTSEGFLGFVRDAQQSPARLEMLRAEGFDAAGWQGLEPLGYHLLARFQTRTPSWFPYDWVPGVEYWSERNAVMIYERNEIPAESDTRSEMNERALELGGADPAIPTEAAPNETA